MAFYAGLFQNFFEASGEAKGSYEEEVLHVCLGVLDDFLSKALRQKKSHYTTHVALVSVADDEARFAIGLHGEVSQEIVVHCQSLKEAQNIIARTVELFDSLEHFSASIDCYGNKDSAGIYMVV